MLVLSRKVGESVIIDGRIVVKIVRLDGDAVRIGIEAPADVPIHRQEIYEEIQRTNQEALTTGRAAVPRLSRRPQPSPTVPVPSDPAL
jgi:carbon storage regulator